jgi:formylglycine-generating enzyme required for sulfatase activity
VSDIFLSYASEDRDRVRPLAEALIQEGWTVFWDRIIPVGETWNDMLEEELEAARSLLVLWSKNSIKSKWVKIEANEGLRKGVPLFPLLLDGVLSPLAFRDIQAADFSRWDGTTESAVFQTLARDIKRTLGSPESPEPGPSEIKSSEPEHVEAPPPETKPPEIRMGRLWLDTQPQKARVKFPNLEVEFAQGMALEPGRYELEVSANGYETTREKVELHAGEDRHISLKLFRIDSAKPQKHKTSEQVRKRRTLLIGIATVVLVILIVGLGILIRKSPLNLSSQEREQKKVLSQEGSRSVAKAAKTITNGLGMKFVLIPAGTFMMGSAKDPEEMAKRYGAQPDWYRPEHPQHQVTISRPFYLQTTEVTQGQWQKVMGYNPSNFEQCGKDCPVENVSWSDAQEFIAKLNRMEKTDKYRLPTEAQWEYACRAGSTHAWCFGDDEANLGEYAWYAKNSQVQTHPVAQKKPNDWGLYDMHGNLWEWCQDWYGEYPAAPITDPEGPSSGIRRVLRGGSWNAYAGCTRSAYRGFSYFPDLRNHNIGFRVARAL